MDGPDPWQGQQLLEQQQWEEEHGQAAALDSGATKDNHEVHESAAQEGQATAGTGWPERVR